MRITIDLIWWLPTAAYLYLVVAVYLASCRRKAWILRLFFVALCFALGGRILSLIIRWIGICLAREAPGGSGNSTVFFELSRWLGLLAWLACPIAAVAAVGVILRLRKLPPEVPATQQQSPVAVPRRRRDKTVDRFIIVMACLATLAITAHIIREYTYDPWLLYMNSRHIGLIAGIGLLATSVCLTLRDRRWLALGLGGIILSLMILFPCPPHFL